jgi:hypothetical protein
MRAAVTHDAKCFWITFSDQFQRDRPSVGEISEWSHGINDRSVEAGGDGGFCETITDTSGDVEG